MTVVQVSTIHPNPGVKWEDVQKQLKRGVTSPVSTAPRT
jgi:hypothetical protein